MPTNLRPQARKRVSRYGLELIKSFEGLRRRAARLPNGRFIVGYGHIRSAREGVEVNPADAEALLRYDLLPIEAAINDWAHAPINQNQFDALVSFAFNIGLSTFRRSDVLRRINEGAMLQAAGAMETWRRVDLDGEPVVVDALVRRRAVEKALFLTPVEGQAPAPSALLKPRIDTTAYASVLLRRPEELQTPLDGDDAVVLRAAPEVESAPEAEEAEPELDLGDQPAALPEEPDAPFMAAFVSEPADAGPVEFEPEAAEIAFEPETAEDEPAPETAEIESEAVEAEFAPADVADLESPADEDIAPEAVDEEPAPELAEEPAEAPVQEHEPEEEHDEAWSAAQAAAAAVTARLSEILQQDVFSDEDEDELTRDDDAEGADGAFLQAPPSPPEENEPPAGAAFPEHDEAALLAFAAETPAEEVGFIPEPADMAELEPFPEDAPPPELDAADQARLEQEWGMNSGAQPSQGDPSALSQDAEGSRNGPYIYLFLGGLALLIAALVSIFRTPAGAAAGDGGGVGWILGLLGIAAMSTALWAVLGGSDADAEDESVDDGASQA